MRRIITALLIISSIVLLASCDPSDPAQRRAFYDLNPELGAEVTAETLNEPQRAVLAHIQAEQGKFLAAVAAAQRDSGDCYVEMREVFPPHAWDRMAAIIHRESRGNPAAQNPTSTAAGCTQLLRLHSPRFSKLGYSWERDRYNAAANIRVAYDLWLAAGWSPWRLTAH